MTIEVETLFARYQRCVAQALAGDAETEEATAFYADALIAATPTGVVAGTNDDRFKVALADGHARYRAMGTKAMRIRALRTSPIDDHHCVAHVNGGRPTLASICRTSRSTSKSTTSSSNSA